MGKTKKGLTRPPFGKIHNERSVAGQALASILQNHNIHAKQQAKHLLATEDGA
jgi:hypothetical protein